MKNFIVFHRHHWEYVWLTDDLEGYRCTVCGKEIVSVEKEIETLIVSEQGVEFRWRGDWVLYVFPWMRSKFNRRFFSTSFNAYYVSLHALDLEWDDYFKKEVETRAEAMRKADLERQHDWVYLGKDGDGAMVYECSKCKKRFYSHVTISGSWNDSRGLKYCDEYDAHLKALQEWDAIQKSGMK